MPKVIIFTGVTAAGKTMVAQHLAGLLSRSVHLRGDRPRTMIVNGREEM